VRAAAASHTHLGWTASDEKAAGRQVRSVSLRSTQATAADHIPASALGREPASSATQVRPRAVGGYPSGGNYSTFGPGIIQPSSDRFEIV